MYEQLIKFIELCLTDGEITEKEREVIFRKATEINVAVDECEIIIESIIQQKAEDFLREIRLQKEQEASTNMKAEKDKRHADLIRQIETEQDNEIKKRDHKMAEAEAMAAKENLKSLGLNPKLEAIFKNGNYTKLWKVNCYLSEPTYAKGNLKIDRWSDSNVNFYVPSNGILNERNAIAFIKANWNNYEDLLFDNSWRSKGRKYDSYSLVDFDKRKIEIIEINEIKKRDHKTAEAEALAAKEKLKSLGLNPKLEAIFKNGNYTKLWKVNCYLSEPTYAKGNLKIDRWSDSNVNFYVPSNGILNERNAIAFIKANWNNYEDLLFDNSWRSKGRKYDSYSLVDFDKRKIEIIEINEILFS